MTIRIASRNLVGAVALLILVACTTGARSVGADETPIIPTPTTTGIITPLLGSPPVPTAIPFPTPAPGGLAFVRTITNADDGGTIQIMVGDRIALALQAPAGSDPWEVALPDAQVLHARAQPCRRSGAGSDAARLSRSGAGAGCDHGTGSYSLRGGAALRGSNPSLPGNNRRRAVACYHPIFSCFSCPDVS